MEGGYLMCAVHTGRGELDIDQRWKRASAGLRALLGGISRDSITVSESPDSRVKLAAKWCQVG